MNVPIWPSLAALFFVLVIIPLSLWLLKSFSKLRPSQQGPLRIIHRIALGPREQIAMLKVGDKTLVVGITSQNIQTLCEFGEIGDSANFSANLIPDQASEKSPPSKALFTSEHPFSILLQRLRKP